MASAIVVPIFSVGVMELLVAMLMKSLTCSLIDSLEGKKLLLNLLVFVNMT